MFVRAIGLQKMFGKKDALFASRPVIYVLIVIFAVIAPYLYKLRMEGIFSCQADGYSSDRYLAYCNGTEFGDYEHGAFWFNLDPVATNYIKNADALFIGNSRIMVALSTMATKKWFVSSSARYYLLGFGYDENVIFTESLLQKIGSQPKVYVVNVDDFFKRSITPPARLVIDDPQSRSRYEAKRYWQFIHKPICKTIPALCGDEYAVFRSRETGAYSAHAGNLKKITGVSYDPAVDKESLTADAASAKEFLSKLNVDHACIILTMVPAVETKNAYAKAIADAVGFRFVVPGPLDGLETMDGSHLDQTSADRWSKAFFETAGGQIQECLQKPRRT